jgi:hypothetical protein
MPRAKRRCTASPHLGERGCAPGARGGGDERDRRPLAPPWVRPGSIVCTRTWQWRPRSPPVDYPAGREPHVYTSPNFPNVMYLLKGSGERGRGDRRRPRTTASASHRAAAGGDRRRRASSPSPHPLPQRLGAGRRGDRPRCRRPAPFSSSTFTSRRSAADRMREVGCTRQWAVR